MARLFSPSYILLLCLWILIIVVNFAFSTLLPALVVGCLRSLCLGSSHTIGGQEESICAKQKKNVCTYSLFSFLFVLLDHRLVGTLSSIDWDKLFSNPSVMGAEFHSACDWPIATYWREIVEFYPDCKVRDD